jgi:hypothetical protein
MSLYVGDGRAGVDAPETRIVQQGTRPQDQLVEIGRSARKQPRLVKAVDEALGARALEVTSGRHEVQQAAEGCVRRSSI